MVYDWLIRLLFVGYGDKLRSRSIFLQYERLERNGGKVGEAVLYKF